MTTTRTGAAQLARMLGDWRRASTATVGYVALAGAVRGLIRDGRLGLRVRLPAERLLATELGASRTTVTAAYRLLREEGYLESRRGSGSHTTLPEGQRFSSTGLWTPDDDAVIDLSCVAPPAPELLAGAAMRAAAALPEYAVGHGYHPVGLPALRAAIAADFTRRGAPTRPDEILVTTGAQQAFDLVMRLLLAPGERVLVESPSYPNALSALALARARVETVGVGPAGWDLEPVLPALAAGRFRLGYLIPEFHNPTGRILPTAQREELLRAARAGGTTLVADETSGDLCHDRDPLPPPMAAVDRHRRLVTVGSMSKSYWGGLRVGWVRAAPALVQRLAVVRGAVDMGCAVLDQLVAIELLAESESILEARRTMLAAQRDVLVTALRKELPDWRFTVPRGGMSLWVELDAPVSTALARSAEAYGVRLAPGPRFGAEGTFERFIRIPFTLPPDVLVEAVGRIAAARSDLDAVRHRSLNTPAVVA